MAQIVLRELQSIAEYQHLERFWGDRRIINVSNGYFRVENPVTAGSIAELVERVREIPYAWKLSVRNSRYNPSAELPHNRKKWRSFMLRELRGAALETVETLASEDGEKRNYIEVIVSQMGRRFEDAAVIEFTERSGRLIGYKARVPGESQCLFEIAGNNYRQINALADPVRLGCTQGALEGRLVLPGDQHTARTG